MKESKFDRMYVAQCFWCHKIEVHHEEERLAENLENLGWKHSSGLIDLWVCDNCINKGVGEV
jgi:hypothetical protein